MDMSIEILNKKILPNILYFSIFAILLALSSVGGQPIEGENVKYSHFEMQLLQMLNKDLSYMDINISPINLKIGLGMLLEGTNSGSDTEKEILTGLKLPQNKTLARKEIKKWVERLKALSSSNLKSANQVFVDLSHKINEHHSARLFETYKVKPTEVDKRNPEKVTGQINDWVEKNTNGLISNILDEPSHIRNPYIFTEASAIYFKGRWKDQFPKYDIREECFFKKGVECIRKKMMNMGVQKYTSGWIYDKKYKLDIKVSDLPFDDGIHSMIILVPREKERIDDFINAMKDYTLANIRFYEVKLSSYFKIPKINVEFMNDMVLPLKSLKMGRISSPFAQFENFTDPTTPTYYLHTNQIFHSTRISINEEGCEAAAATVINGAWFVREEKDVSSSQNEDFKGDQPPTITSKTATAPTTGRMMVTEHYRHFLSADGPFVILIRDISKNTVLFAAKYIGTEYKLN